MFRRILSLQIQCLYPLFKLISTIENEAKETDDVWWMSETEWIVRLSTVTTS